VALINSLTTKPKLNVSNIKSPFGGGAPIPKISAGTSSFIKRPLGQGSIKPKSPLSGIDTFQIKTNIENIDKRIAMQKRIDILYGSVSNLNQELVETNKVLKDIGNAVALDFANRITEQKKANKELKSKKDSLRKEKAEEKIEGAKGGIGKGIGIGSRLSGIAQAGTGLNLGGIIDAAKLLGLGIAINALWPKMEDIFNWTMNNLDKVLLVGGAILALNVVGGIGTLLKLGALLSNPWVLALLGLAGSAFVLSKIGQEINDARVEADQIKRDQLLQEGVDPGKVEQLIEGTRLRDTAIPGDVDYKGKDGGLFGPDPLGIRWQNDPLGNGRLGLNSGGIVPGSGNTDTVPAMLTPGEGVIDADTMASIAQKPRGINLIEMDLPPIRIPPKEKKVQSGETTEVNYISSINVTNPYMSKTPELHGILV
tara:strand:- start:284 stop:1558 length:1275 start_codon:yes stop_codon:yes gene_type:complete